MWKVECKMQNGRSKITGAEFDGRFPHYDRRDGGPLRLHALVFAKSPALWSLPN